jgi:hypothetical protein
MPLSGIWAEAAPTRTVSLVLLPAPAGQWFSEHRTPTWGNTQAFSTQPWTIIPCDRGGRGRAGLHVQAIATTVKDWKLSNFRYT